jgi:hypothetical protein
MELRRLFSDPPPDWSLERVVTYRLVADLDHEPGVP